MSEDRTKKKRTVIEITAASVVVLGIIGISLAFYFRLIPMPRFMRVIFGTDYSEDGNIKEPEDDIPDVTGLHSAFDGDEVYFDLSPAKLFDMLEEEENYTCFLRITTVWEGRSGSVRCSLEKDGARFRIESEDRLTIFNGCELYTLAAGHDYFASVTDCDCYTELGITSLDSLKSMDISEENLSLSSDYKTLSAAIYNDEGSLTDEYKISVESGIITEEYHYDGGELYRSAVCENIVLNGASDEDFTVPAE